MSLNLLEPILDESLLEESEDDDVVHRYCRACYPRDGVIQIAHCGKDISNDRKVKNWLPSEECAMCYETRRSFRTVMGFKLCPKGHVLSP